jgi:hypothetical protein
VVLFILFLCTLFRHDVNVAVHAFVIIVLSRSASVFKVGGEGAFCWRSFLQHLPRLVDG